MSSQFSFYMIKCNKNGDVDYSTKKNIVQAFPGLTYSKCEGLNTIGAAKNIYEEKYADADGVRVYIPNVIYNEATTVKLTLFFVGADRHAVRDDFNDYIRHGYTKYWDNARKRVFQFYVSKELPVGEEKWYGSTPYLKCEYILNNINGKTTFQENDPFTTT